MNIKRLFFLISILAATTARAQISIVRDSIPQLYGLSYPNGTMSFVKDSISGGFFRFQTAAAIVDSGVVIPAIGGVWVRAQVDRTVKADWWFDRPYSSAVKKAIVFLSNRGGGTILLSNRTYTPTFYDINNKMPYDNISLVGVKKPYYNSDCSGLLGGTIIQGSFIVAANNFSATNIGFDAGLNVSNAYGIEGDGFGIGVPSLVSYNPFSGFNANGIVTLCKSPGSLFHAALFEGIENAYINDITAVFGVHGIVIKGVDVQADNLKSYAHAWNGIILKSDIYALYNKVQIGSILYDSFPPRTVPYTNQRCDNGINIFPNNTMGSTYISEVIAYHCTTGFLVGGPSSLGNVHIGRVQTDFTTNGINWTQSVFRRVSIDAINISNSINGIMASSSGVAYPINMGAVYVSNMSFSGGTALSLTDNVQLSIDYFRQEMYNTPVSISGVARLKFGSDSTEGNFGSNPYHIITNNTKRISVLGNGNIGMNNDSPAFPLDVAGETRIQGKISSRNATADNSINMQSGSITIPNIQASDFADAVSKDLTIQKFGGNVGIGNISPNSTFHVEGSISFAPQTITGTTTLGNFYRYNVNNSSDIVLNLPSASGISGRTYSIKKISNNANTITITPASGTIDGASTLIMSAFNISHIIYTDGTNWFIE